MATQGDSTVQRKYTISHQGWLKLVSSDARSKPQRRYFVLKSDDVLWYHNDFDEEAGEPGKRSKKIDLTEVREIASFGGLKEEFRYGINIHTESRTYTLYCPDKGTRTEWVECLQGVEKRLHGDEHSQRIGDDSPLILQGQGGIELAERKDYLKDDELVALEHGDEQHRATQGQRWMASHEHNPGLGKQLEDINCDGNSYTWDYCMIFAIGDEGDVIKLTKKTDGEKVVEERPEKQWYKEKTSEAFLALQNAGLEVTSYRSAQGDEVYVLIGATEIRLMAEADRIDLDLPLDRDNALALGVRIGVRLATKTQQNIDKGGDDKTRFCNLDDWENLFAKYDQQTDQKIYLRHDDEHRHENSVFQQTDRMKLIVSIIEAEPDLGGAGLAVSKLIRTKEHPCLAWFPLHDTEQCRDMESKWKPYHMFTQPVDMVRNYFGEKIALYFAFLGFYNRALVVPAILGAIFIIIQGLEGRVGAQNVWFLGFSVSVWGTMFLELWKRHEAKLRVRWGQTSFREKEQPRPEFDGDLINSPIDGSLEYYFPWHKKLLKVVFSNTIIFTMIAAVVAAVSGIFVAKAVVADREDAGPEAIYGMALVSAVQIQVLNIIYAKLSEKLNENENHKTDTDFENALIAKSFLFKFVNSYNTLFYIAFVKGLPLDSGHFLVGAGCRGATTPYFSLPGASDECADGFEPGPDPPPASQNWFNDAGKKMDEPVFCCGGPSPVYPIVDNTLCCDPNDSHWDDFNTPSSRGLICKYIYDREPCLDELRIQLLIIFAAQIVSANLVEYLKPIITQKLAQRKESKGLADEQQRSKAELEYEKAPCESTFDDYDELVIQYGYVILFIVAMPLTPLLALANNFVETWLDSRKLTRLSRRPEPRGASDIGTWMTILNVITIIAVGTNVALCIFLANQFDESEGTIGKIWVFVIVEHLILLMKTAAEYFVPDEPRWVQEHILRQAYVEGTLIGGARDEKDEADFEKDLIDGKKVEVIDFEQVPIGPQGDQNDFLLGGPHKPHEV